MTVLARRIRATPFRSAAEAWEVIVNLLAPATCTARDELTRIAGIASSLIASEATATSPIVVSGSGPRLRVYCLFGDDAVSGDDASEQPLTDTPMTRDWTMSLPCPEEDLPWVETALAKHSQRITTRILGEKVETQADDADAKSASMASVDREAFFRP